MISQFYYHSNVAPALANASVEVDMSTDVSASDLTHPVYDLHDLFACYEDMVTLQYPVKELMDDNTEQHDYLHVPVLRYGYRVSLPGMSPSTSEDESCQVLGLFLRPGMSSSVESVAGGVGGGSRGLALTEALGLSDEVCALLGNAMLGNAAQTLVLPPVARRVRRHLLENLRDKGEIGLRSQGSWALETGQNATEGRSGANATTEPSADAEIAAEMLIDSAVRGSADEVFEPGMESSLSRRLEQLWRIWRENVCSALQNKLADPTENPEVLAEMLRWLGQTEMPPEWKDTRLTILISGLQHASPLVRDSAALAMSQLGDERAVSLIEDAAHREKIRHLREDLFQIVASLKS